MNVEKKFSIARLERREMIECREGIGNVIVCLSGSLWITRLGHREDIILKPGQSVVLDGNGYAVVQGLACSTLRIMHRHRLSANTLGYLLRENLSAVTGSVWLKPAGHS